MFQGSFWIRSFNHKSHKSFISRKDNQSSKKELVKLRWHYIAGKFGGRWRCRIAHYSAVNGTLSDNPVRVDGVPPESMQYRRLRRSYTAPDTPIGHGK